MALLPCAEFFTGRRRLRAVLAKCLLLAFAFPGMARAAELSLATDTLIVSGPGPYQLAKHPVIENSETVVVGEARLAREEDYTVNYRLGLITFITSAEEPPESLVAIVTYRFFPFTLDERYFRNELAPTESGEKQVMEKKPEKKEPSGEPSTLVIGGSKSLGVSVGREGDVALEQALRVNISGMATEDVEVRAVLSDQSTPIQPEGTTEELEELDQVLLEVEGKNMSASFGDYDLAMKSSGFGSVERKLEGGMAEARLSGASFMAAAARNRGYFASNRFSGIDGKQGPYQLSSESGATEIAVVAGSERVYVDGELRRRGESNDYVIDYSLGQVSFTSRVLVTSRSRILVDFEYSTLDYRRSLYAGSASYSSMSGRLLIGGSLLREGDDKDSPVSLTITPERRQALDDAGDDSSLAWVSGAVYVGESLGTYILQDSFYVYVGYNKGDYSVSFTEAGGNRGDYEFDYVLGGYRYVGQNMGNYTARIRLPLPAREQFQSVGAQYSLGDRTKARVEYASSISDRNTFSEIGDGDNTGGAYDLSFESGFEKKLHVGTRYRSWDRRFSFPGRRNNEDYEDFWDVREAQGEESVGEAQVGVSPVDFLRLTSGFGRLRRENGKAERIDLGAAFARNNMPSISYAYSANESDIDTTEGRTRHTLTGTQRFGLFSPRASLFLEETNERLAEGTGGLSFGNDRLKADLSYGHRLDYTKQAGGWAREARVRTAKLSLEASGSGRISGSVNLAHRDKKFAEGFPGDNSSYDLAGLRLKARPLEERMSVEAIYELTCTQLSTTREVYYEVEKGEGDYSKDPNTGEYYPDPEGDYRKRVVQTGDTRPVSEVSSSVRINTLPLDLLSFDGFVTLDQKSAKDESFGQYAFDPGRFHDDSAMVYGSASVGGDLNLYPHERRSIGLRARYDEDEENQLESMHAERERLELSLLGRARLSSTVSGEGEISTRSSQRRSTEKGLEREEKWDRLRTTLTMRPNASLEPSVSAVYETGRIAEPYYYPLLGTMLVNVYEMSPRIRYYLKGRGRIETGVTLTERRSGAGRFPADVETMYPMGFSTAVRSSLEYRLNEWLTAFLSHDVRKEPARETEHSMRAEMRASF